ncbi:MAG: SUMF1/EgtB/PvdO family nonheme iron enzyme [Myxococcota bacterium]
MGTSRDDATEQTFGTLAVELKTEATVDHGHPSPAPPADISAVISAVDPEDRYEDIRPIAQGGMGEVRRVFDRRLNRHAVMKVVHVDLAQTSAARRLRIEAEITGQLQHPGVVPVYDSGTLRDGRPFYVMREVQGKTLYQAIHELDPEGVPAAATGFRRLIEALRRVCDTMAYAHRAGVIHRDIKPHNLMVEDFGSVLVLDWGIARRQADVDWLSPHTQTTTATRFGTILGTSGYMSPEQAAGHSDRVGTKTDVYALGVTLGDVLRCAIVPPPVLARLALRAQSQDPDLRPTVQEMGEEIQAWLDGARRREEAMVAVARADKMRPRIDALRTRAIALAEQASAILKGVKTYAPIEEKAPAWEMKDEAERLREEAALAEHRWEQMLHHALRLAPDLEEAHRRLADHYHQLHLHEQNPTAAVRYEELLRQHDRGTHRSYLSGEGGLVLETDPPGAEAVLYRFALHRRRLVPVRDRVLGKTPLHVSIPHGSCLIEFTHQDCDPVKYPVLIPRGGEWNQTPPHGQREPIFLPPAGTIADDEAYVPAGWFQAGGDPEAADSLMPGRWMWADGFVIKKFPVTNQQYLIFLNTLYHSDRVQDAVHHQPLRGNGQGTEGTASQPIYKLDSVDGFSIPEERLHLPVTGILWTDAVAYTEWASTRTGFTWRLPHDLEWEKSTRGVDGRLWPWSNYSDACWANTSLSREGQPKIEAVGSWAGDVSLYGIRDLIGNVHEFCINPYRRNVSESTLIFDTVLDKDAVLLRGGAFNRSATLCRAALRVAIQTHRRYLTVGFRLTRPILRGYSVEKS